MTIAATAASASAIKAGPTMVGSTTAGSAVAPADLRLIAGILSVAQDEPIVRIVREPETGGSLSRRDRLPEFGFALATSGSLEGVLRTALRDLAGTVDGYVEQLQTHVLGQPPGYDSASAAHRAMPSAVTALAIDYMALVPPRDVGELDGWESWYLYFPWEDWRRQKPTCLTHVIEPALQAWAARPVNGSEPAAHATRAARVRMAFGQDNGCWNEERVLERHDLLVEAGLLEGYGNEPVPPATDSSRPDGLGVALEHHHRRALARAIGRLRSRVKSCPLVFDLMPERFTLFELQRTVEAILGPHLHKQNFRRLVEQMGLVEPADGINTRTGGRPAKLFRFRPQVLVERPQPGVRVRAGRSG
jgi:hypothetical protein